MRTAGGVISRMLNRPEGFEELWVRLTPSLGLQQMVNNDLWRFRERVYRQHGEHPNIGALLDEALATRVAELNWVLTDDAIRGVAILEGSLDAGG